MKLKIYSTLIAFFLITKAFAGNPIGVFSNSMVADTCITPPTILKNTTIPAGNPIIDEACLEVNLEEGFETADNADYTAQTGNGTGTSAGLIGQTFNNENEQISLIIRPKVDKVLLRWIPEDPDHWNYVSKLQYQIQRQELTNGVWVNSANFTNKIVKGISKSDTLNWRADSLQMVTFTTTTDAISNDDISVFFKYLTMSSLYNANYPLAVKSGHGFEDTDVVANKSYRYKIIATLANGTVISSGNFMEVLTSTKGDLPKLPVTLSETKVGNGKKVTLRWKADGLKSYYGSYDIWRSTSNVAGTFVKLNKMPLQFSDDNDNPDPDTTRHKSSPNITDITYFDEVPNISAKYFYKIVGNTYFNETKDFDIVDLIIKKEHLYAPIITGLQKQTQNTKVTFVFPAEGNNALLDSVLATNAWKLMISKNSDSDYVPLVTNVIKTERSITYQNASISNIWPNPIPSNYYLKIEGTTKDNQTLSSLAFLVATEDKTPPAKPQLLTLSVKAEPQESRKIVTIKWAKNTETDLLGYVVKRRVGLNDSLYVIASPKFKIVDPNTNELVPDNDLNMATDTLYDNLTMPDIYYSVNAIDYRYNASDSAQIVLKSLDLIRPVSPVLHKLILSQLPTPSITLNFSLSPERSAINRIYRIDESLGSVWTMIKAYPANTVGINSFIDATVSPNNVYYYAIVATDQNGNESCFKTDFPAYQNNTNLNSDPSNGCYQIMSAATQKNLERPAAITTFNATTLIENNSIKLDWVVSSSVEIVEFEIYKSEYLPTDDTTNLKEYLYKIVNTSERSFIDLEPTLGKINRYRIRAILPNNKFSAWKDVIVNL